MKKQVLAERAVITGETEERDHPSVHNLFIYLRASEVFERVEFLGYIKPMNTA